MKSTFIQNENQIKQEIFIKTPNRDGTMVIQDDVLEYDYRNDAIPVYRDCADGNKRIVRGPVEIIRDGDGSIGTAGGVKFHSDKSDVTVQVGGRNTTTQTMPSGDGFILNSSSVVDCGEIDFNSKGTAVLSENNVGKTSKDLE